MAKDETMETASEAPRKTTPPTGQGGATPKDRPDHQDQFPPNPEPSESAKAYARKIEKYGSNVLAAAAPDE